MTMKDAFTAFQSGQTNKAIEIYQEIIDSNGEERFTALLNRSSAFYSLGMFPACLNDLDIYLSESPAPRVEGYVLYINTFIQTKTKPSSSQEKIIDKGKQLFPEHAKLKAVIASLQEILIGEDEELFMQKMLEKLVMYPQMRACLQQQPFLTKLQKMLRNPTLSKALIKLDSRLAEAQELLMMATSE